MRRKSWLVLALLMGAFILVMRRISHTRPAGSSLRKTQGRDGEEPANHDPLGFSNALQASERFSRDTARGGMFHGKSISIRENSNRNSLHLSFGEGNRLSAHIDRFSPLARGHSGWLARYSLPRIVVHVCTDVMSGLAQLITRRRDQYRLDLDCDTVELSEGESEGEVKTTVEEPTGHE